MARVKKDSIQKLLDSVSLFDHISLFTKLQRSGSRHKGLCPFHQEKTPSFFVYDQWFYCFGCQAHGNLIDFEKNRTHLSFPEILQQLSERYQIPLEYESTSAITPSFEHQYAILEQVHRFYQNKLWSEEGTLARNYLFQRGFQEKHLKEFQIGFANQNQALLNLVRQKGWDPKELQSLGLLKEDRDFFSHRILFPIHNHQGRVVAFGGRTIPGLSHPNQPKYLNSSESDLFKKRRLLYQLFSARNALSRSDFCLVVEGYLDVLLLRAAGFEEVVGVLGTQFTEFQARALSRYSQSLILCFDGDEAGQRAMTKTFQLLFPLNLFSLKAFSLPKGKDPADLIKEQSLSSFRTQITQAPSLLETYWRHFAAHLHSQDPAYLLRKVRSEIIPIIFQNADGGQRQIALNFLAKKLELTPSLLLPSSVQKPASSKSLSSSFQKKSLTLTCSLSFTDLRCLSLMSFLPQRALKDLFSQLFLDLLFLKPPPQNPQELFLLLTWSLKPLFFQVYLKDWQRWFQTCQNPQESFWQGDFQGEDDLSHVIFLLLKTLHQKEFFEEFQDWIQKNFTEKTSQNLKTIFSPQKIPPPSPTHNFFSFIRTLAGQKIFQENFEGSLPEQQKRLLVVLHFLQMETLQLLKRFWWGTTPPPFEWLSQLVQDQLQSLKPKGLELLSMQKKLFDQERDQILRQFQKTNLTSSLL